MAITFAPIPERKQNAEPSVNNIRPIEAPRKLNSRPADKPAKRGRPRKTAAGFDRAAYMREYRKRSKVEK